jgi:hypothetical protein
MSMEF